MKKKLVLSILVIAFIAAFFIIGGHKLAISRIAKATTTFHTWPTDERILYERGAEKLAGLVATHFETALETIETQQHGQFNDDVRVYAFATPNSFSRCSGLPELVKGGSYCSEVYLSGMLKKIPHEVKGMLIHEMSHVQLTQKLGVIDFNRTLPRWFREGLAIYVSDGGGATRASEQETIDHFIQGRHFLPVQEGSLLSQELSATSSIRPKIFYRQSGNFVRFLAQAYPTEYQGLLVGLQAGKSFKQLFFSTFKATPQEILDQYKGLIKRDAMAPS